MSGLKGSTQLARSKGATQLARSKGATQLARSKGATQLARSCEYLVPNKPHSQGEALLILRFILLSHLMPSFSQV
jgi:hypothetical protein